MKKILSLTLGLSLLGLAGAQNTGPQFVNNMVRAGETITNTGLLQGQQGDGSETFESVSNTVQATVQQIADVNILLNNIDTSSSATPAQTVTTRPGEAGELIFQLINTGNGTDTFTLVYGSTSPQAPLAWIDLNGNMAPDPGESFASGTQFSLTPGVTYLVHVFTPVPAGAAGTDVYTTSLRATSQFNGATDSDNFGAIDVLDQLAVTLEQNADVDFNAGQTITTTKTLSNTGNIAFNSLNAATIEADTNNLLTFSYVVGTGQASTTLQGALDSSFTVDGALQPGQSRPVVITATAANTGLVEGNQIGLVHTLTMNPDADDEVLTASESDTTTYYARVFSASNVKAQAVCSDTGSGFTCGPMDSEAKVAAPCDIIVYGITARSLNPGGILRAPVLRDQLPSTVTPLRAFAHMAPSQGSFPTGATPGLVSMDKTDWRSLLDSADMTTNPVIVYGGYDSNDDGVINNSDVMTQNNILSLSIISQVKGTGCSIFDPSNPGINFPSLPYNETNTSVQF